MQMLLTGKKRLKGFNEVWSEVKFEDSFVFVKSYSISRDELTTSHMENPVYCIHYGDIHALYENEFLDFSNQQSIPQISGSTEFIKKEDFLKDGDIIMADASEDYEGVGEAVEVININKKVAVGGLHTIVLRDTKKITSQGFRTYLFASETLRNELRKKATGSSVYSVTRSTLQSLKFKIPGIQEQITIAGILRNADKEIQHLKTKLEKLKDQKKGLMQKLLTGQIRVKL